MNGPVPTGLVALVGANSGPTIEASPCARLNRKKASFLESCISTVVGSTTVTEAIGAKMPLDGLVLSLAMARSKENFTSSASKVVPSWNFTPESSLNV